MNDEEIRIKRDEAAEWLDKFISGFDLRDTETWTYNRLIELVIEIRLNADLIKPVNPELANDAIAKANLLNVKADERRDDCVNISTMNR